MQLRNGKNTINSWPIVQNTIRKYPTWGETETQLYNLCIGVSTRDLLYQRTVFIKASYMMMNNKQFSHNSDYRKVLKELLLKLDVNDTPKYITKLFHQIRMLPRSIAKQRWGVFKVCTKLLHLHKKAAISANHPSRIDFTIVE